MDEKIDINGYTSDVEGAKALASRVKKFKGEVAKSIVGQEEAIQLVLNAILSNGHSLLVGVPGLAKTLLVQTIAKVLKLKFGRIQFTPDLMPSDITGAEILDSDRNFKFIEGPIFTNLLLADEINRTPPKTQAALLEAMQEKKITVGGNEHLLPEPFFTLATQNPIEQEGTYPLPEAQLDRFMYQINLDYPSFEEEVQVVKNTTSDLKAEMEELFSPSELLYFQSLVRRVPVADNVIEYAVNLVSRTRPSKDEKNEITKKYITYGAGPRASQFLILGAKSNALLNGKLSPDIEDIRNIALPVLRHRIRKNYVADAEGYSVDKIIKSLF